MNDKVIAQGWVVKRNRGGMLGGQVWRYLLFRARQLEGKGVELKGFYAEEPSSASARMIFDWSESKSLSFALSDSSITPTTLLAAADIPLVDGDKVPQHFPHDLQWLILTSNVGGVSNSFAFGCELPRVLKLGKRLAEFGVPFGRVIVASAGASSPTPSLYAGKDVYESSALVSSSLSRIPTHAGYCDKRGGGTSMFG